MNPKVTVRFRSNTLQSGRGYLLTKSKRQIPPQLAFFGHYHTRDRLAECEFGQIKVYWMSGLELLHGRNTAELYCVGLLTVAD